MKIGLAFTLKPDDIAPDAARPDDWAEEFDSPTTVAALRAVFESRGHTVFELGDGPAFVRRLLADPVDLVFNIAEGQGIGRARESRLPAVCELLGIPCTGSDPATLAVALDKHWARLIVQSAGVIVPGGHVYDSDGIAPGQTSPVYPLILKPSWEGSSKGIRGKCISYSEAETAQGIARLTRDYAQPILAEQFIAGDELTVGIVGNDPPRVVGVMRVVPLHDVSEFVYSLEVKRDWQNHVRYECPAQIGDEDLAAVERAALDAYRALGCRDVARIDFRLRDGMPYFIEANPLPGLSPESGDLVFLARFMGIDHATLVGMIFDAACERLGLPTS